MSGSVIATSNIGRTTEFPRIYCPVGATKMQLLTIQYALSPMTQLTLVLGKTSQ